MSRLCRVGRAAMADMLAHARDEAPNECCGLVLGTADFAERAVRCRNLLQSPTRFLLDPADHLAALKATRGSTQSVVGVYHSHPQTAPVLSETDRLEAAYPEYVHLIVSPSADPAHGEIRAYSFDRGNFFPLELVPVG